MPEPINKPLAADAHLRVLSYAEAEAMAAARKLSVAEFHAELKAAIGQDGEIDDGAHQAATSPLNDLPRPTPAQIESGNYRKGHVRVGGFDITIENPAGSERKGVGPDGKPWSVMLKAHYGYVKRSAGADGDQVDVFLRPGIEPDHDGPLFVIAQLDSAGNFDEHKVMWGWPDRDAAQAAYLENYGDGWSKKRIGSIDAMSPVTFKSWLDYPWPTYFAPVTQIDSDAEECEAAVQILSDAKGAMRVRQLAMVCDSLNRNRRVYPRPVVLDAIGRVRPLIDAGAVLSEMEHPAVVDVCDRGSCGERFVDGGPERKTARVTAIYDPDEQGRVYIDREILDTPDGQIIQERIRKLQPAGISTRFSMRGAARKIGDSLAQVASWMTLFTFDDVKNPAVEGAGAYTLLSDCELQAAMSDSTMPDGSLGDPFNGNPNNTVNPAPLEPEDPIVEEIARDSSTSVRPGAQELSNMNANILALLRGFRLEAKKGTAASADALNTANKAIVDAFRGVIAAGERLDADTVQLYRSAHGDAEQIPGFVAGKEGPYGQLASELGDDPTSGWGPDASAGSGESKNVNANTKVDPTTKSMASADAGSATDEDREFVRQLRAERAASADSKAKADAVESAISAITGDEAHPIHKLDRAASDSILAAVRKASPTPESVPTLIDALIAPISKAAADATLAARGLHGHAAGNTVVDPANPLHRASTISQPVPNMVSIERMEAAYDDMMRSDPLKADEFGWEDPEGPNSKDVVRRRAANRKVAMPILEQQFGRMAQSGLLRGDSFGEDSALEELQSVLGGDSVAYNTLITNVYNQPTVAMWLLLQPFQDMRFLEVSGAIGPGQTAQGGTPGWETQQGFGRVLKVPSETFVEPSGYSGTNGMAFDLNVAENAGIPPSGVNTYWDTFSATWRKIAATASIEAINAIGRGPLNYPLVMRLLWHMAARKCRTIDTLLGNESVNAALEYGAVAVASEAYTTGGTNGLDLAANSMAVASGALSINLNPQKTASTAIAATDKSAVYGTGNATGGAAVVAALRLKAGGGGGVDAIKGTYCSLNQSGPTPIVPPRSLLTLTGPGADSTSTQNPTTITLPVAQVLGYLGPDGNIYSLPGTTATYAVDYINGVIVFIAGQVTRSGSVFTTATTVAPYSYATNFDYFVLQDNEISLGTGETLQAYYNKLLGRIDKTAAAMGGSPNFVRPDLGTMSLKTAAAIVQATIFYKLNSPDGTDLYPDETYFARRNGVNLMRVNAPWWLGDNGIVMSRKGTTKYAIDTPFATRGPIGLFDSNGLPIAGEGYYGAENSAICTPQVKDQTGAIKASVSRLISLY